MTRTFTGGAGGDGVTVTNALEPGNVPSSVPGSVTVRTQGNVRGDNATLDNHININLNAGNDTLVARNVPWATDDSEENASFSNVEMGDGDDLVDFDRAAVRFSLNTGAGNDTVLFHNSFSRSISLGSGDDLISLTTDASQVSDEELEAKASAITDGFNINVDGGAGGEDTLILGGEWTIALDRGAQFTLNDGTRTNTLAWNDLSLVSSMPSVLNGEATFPPFSRGSISIDAPITFSNFESLRQVCFTAGTMVDTPTGQVAIETLKEGDPVVTRHGIKPLKWIGKRRLDVVDLGASPRSLPVRVPAGAFGEGLPTTDLLFSPQHRVVVRSAIAQRLFEASEVLVSVKHLIGINGIEVDGDIREVTYIHVMFDEHTTLEVGGIEAESLYLGPEALKSLSRDALSELRAIFPDLMQMIDAGAEQELVMPVIKGRDVRVLTARHQKNGQPFYR